MAVKSTQTVETPEKRKPVLIEYIDGDTTEAEPTDEELAFQAFQQEFSESDTYAKITVYRQPTGPGNRPGQKKLAFLFECGVDEYTFSQLLSKLRDEYGSGTYRLQARDSKGGLQFNRAVEIEATKVKPQNSGTESPGDLMRAVQEMMNASQERTEQMIARLREPAKPALDPMQMMALSMQMFTQMIGAMAPILGAAKPAGGDILSEIEKLSKVQDFLGGFGGDRASPAEANFYDLATQGLKTVAPLLANLPAVLASRQGAPVAPPQVIEHEPPAQGAPRQNIPRNTSQQGPQVENVNLKNQVNLLVGQAEAGTSAEDLANMVLNMTPDEKVADLKAFISRPTVIDEMAAYNPAVNTKHRQYFETLKSAILRMLAEEESAAGSSGDAG